MQSLHHTDRGGFTLIELIVVIVILGILAATALPKFADLGADARVSSINAVRGSLAATAAMVHGKYLSTTPAPTSVTMEGSTVNITNGYPTADTNFATAAGLNGTDYTITAASNTLTVSPTGATTPADCAVVYTEAASTSAAPTVAVTTTGC